MKRNVFIGAICTLVVLLLAACVFVACNDNKTETYTVTFRDGTANIREVKVKAGSELKEADIPAGPLHDGEEFDGWFIEDAQVSAGFVPQADCVALAKYHAVEEQPEDDTLAPQVLESLRGNILFEGTLTDHYTDGTQEPSTIHSMYDAQLNLVLQYEIWNDQVWDYFLVTTFGNDGLAYTPYHDQYGNVRYMLPTNSEGNELQIQFADIANPFEYLTAKKLIKVSDTAYTVDSEDAEYIIYALTGYEYQNGIKTFEIQVEDGKAKKLIYTTDYQNDNNLTYYVGGDIDITGGVSLPAEYVHDYPEQPELKAALEKAAAATSYTVDQTVEGSDEHVKAYFKDDLVWVEQPGDNSYGYVVRPDGNAWRFQFNGSDMVIDSTPAAGNIAAVAATFIPLVASYSMFKLVDGKYVLRQEDIDNYGTALVSYCAMPFATGLEQQNLFNNYAFELAIILDDEGDLDKVEVTYAVVSNTISTVTLTLDFNDFNSAQLPTDLHLDKDVINGTIEATYVGTWRDSVSGMRVDVTPDNIAVNGIPARKVTKSADGYTAEVGGLTYTFSMQNGVLTLQEGGNSYTLRRRACDWEDMLGTYSYSDGDNIVQLTITESNLTLRINDSQATLNAENFMFSEEDGATEILFMASTAEGTQYVIITLLAKNKAVNVWMGFDDDDYTLDANLYAENYDFDDWSEFVGSYSDGTNTLEVTADSITIVYDGETHTFEKENILYEAVEYGAPSFTMVDGSTTYGLQQYGSTTYKIALFIAQGSDTSPDRATVYVREGYEPADWSIYVGNFIDQGDESYSVRITASALYLTISGVEYTASDIDFDTYLFYALDGSSMWLDRFDFTANGKAYSLRQYAVGSVELLSLLEVGESSNLPLATLGRDDKEDLEDWSKYYGTYAWSDYSITVAEQGLTVTLDGSAVNAERVTFYGRTDYVNGGLMYAFDFVVNDDNYTLQFVSGQAAAILTSDALKLMLVGTSYEPETNRTTWEGYYATKDNNLKFKLTADEVSFAMDGGKLAPATLVYFAFVGEDESYKEALAVIEFNGEQYFVTLTDQIVSVYDDTAAVSHHKEELDVAIRTDEPEEGDAWKQYAGTYTGSSPDSVFKVVISDSGITLSIDNGPAMQATNITLSYNAEDDEYDLKFTVNGVNYTMAFYNNGSIGLSPVRANLHKN